MKQSGAEHGSLPFLTDRQRYALRCLRDFARPHLMKAEAADQNRCDPALVWLDDLLDGSGFAEVGRADKHDFVKGEGGFAYGDPRAHAVAELRSALADFSRNGRWGTCGACPCDGYGRKLPELCDFTERDDHQADIDGLSRRFKDEVAAFEKHKGPREE